MLFIFQKLAHFDKEKKIHKYIVFSDLVRIDLIIFSYVCAHVSRLHITISRCYRFSQRGEEAAEERHPHVQDGQQRTAHPADCRPLHLPAKVPREPISPAGPSCEHDLR